MDTSHLTMPMSFFGGSVLFNYERYKKISKRDVSVVIRGSKFVRNRAYGHICTSERQGGNGGAIAIVGAYAPGVFAVENEFIENNAVTYEPGASTSLGGAISISLRSNLSSIANHFYNNYAVNGGGHDVSSISGQSGEENYWNSTRDVFRVNRGADFPSDLDKVLAENILHICKSFASLKSASSSSSKRRRNMQFIEADGRGGFTPFVISPHSEQILTTPSRDLFDLEPVGRGDMCSVAARTILRDKHYDTLDSYLEASALSDDDIKVVVRISLDFLLRLDLWKMEIECGSAAEGVTHEDIEPLHDLEQRFRKSLMLTLSNPVLRVRRGSHSMSSGKGHAINVGLVAVAIAKVVKLSPDIVLTSGRANMIGSEFIGNYHVFVGNYPTIYRRIVGNSFLDPLLVTVPSFTLLTEPDVNGSLVLTSIDATVEIATRLKGDNTFIDQLNFFQSELVLNNNLTIRNTR